MARWNIQIDDTIDRTVRTHVARNGGKKGDLSKFVEQAVKRAVFWETMDSVHERNRGVDPAAIEADVDRAVEEARALRP